MGPVEGERLTSLITSEGLPWNVAFGGGPVKVSHEGPLPTVQLGGGIELTVLSPGHDQLFELRQKWMSVIGEGGLDPQQPLADPYLQPPGRLERMGGFDVDGLACAATQIDHAVANGSSIAMLARWGDHSCLTTGDAHAEVMLAAIDRLVGPGGVLSVDVFKLPHHGSKSNVTTELMKRVDAKVYVFSSSGEGRSQHPNDEAVARVIVNSTGDRCLAFNYRNPRTTAWENADLCAQRGYRTLYPNAAHGGVSIDLTQL